MTANKSPVNALVHYVVTIQDEQPLELQVEARFTGQLASGDSLLLQTPSWVAGDYNFTQLARDIFSITAHDTQTKKELKVTREGWQGFRVHSPSKDVTVKYRAYAFEPEFGEPSGIVDNHYAVLLGTRYLYFPQHLGPCRVQYVLPDRWEKRIHHPSGATPVGSIPNCWEYPSYEVLVDTPVVMGQYDIFKREVYGKPIYFVFVDRGVGFEARVEAFVNDLAKIAEFYHSMFGAFPFEDYTFVMSLNPQNEWGLEHLTSTMCGLTADVFTDDDTYKVGVRVCSHEMFHAWNVRRLRPAPLGQLQHHMENGCFTPGLWVAEGFTRYYEFLSCTATGIYSVEEFFSNIVGYYEHLTVVPAYERVSVADSSLGTYLNHNPKYPGRVNNCIDYYDKGMQIAFGIDARLRLAAKDKSLNRAFSDFYSQFVHWPIPVSDHHAGYTTDDVVEFFNQQLPGLGAQLDREVNLPGGLQTEELLTQLGFEVLARDIHYLGLVFTDDGVTIYNVLDNSPAGKCGIAPQDVIVRVNGFQVTTTGLKWAATNPFPAVLDVLRGHRCLQFTVTPGVRRAISAIVWQGNETQRARLSAWFGREVQLTKGQVIPIDFYENFHGIETVL